MTNKHAFAQKFRPAIRTCFNWNLFLSEDWPIEIVTLDDARQFQALRLPWYLNSNSGFVSFDSEGAHPVHLSEVRRWFGYLASQMRQDITTYEREFQNVEDRVSFEFPSYVLPENQYLVLDGNHKLCALARLGVAFSLQMSAVNGPLNEAVVPDLRHFAQ